jgi:hypothetical protein
MAWARLAMCESVFKRPDLYPAHPNCNDGSIPNYSSLIEHPLYLLTLPFFPHGSYSFSPSSAFRIVPPPFHFFSTFGLFLPLFSIFL